MLEQFLINSSSMDRILIGSVVLLVLTLVATLIYGETTRSKTKKANGRENEKNRALAPLRAFARSNGFRLIEPATLCSKGKEAKLDAIVVGYFGVIGVIALGYNGEIYGDAGQSEWVQILPNKTRINFPNPITEAVGGVRVVRDALFEAGQKKVPVEIHCVFTYPNVQVAVPRSVGVLEIGAWKTLLKKERYLDDTGLDLDVVEQAIRKALAE